MLNETQMKEQNKPDTLESQGKIQNILNVHLVNLICFVLIMFSLICCSTLCFLVIWGTAENDLIWRVIFSFLVMSITSFIFATINKKLG